VLVWARLRDEAVPASCHLIQTATSALRLQPAFERARIASHGSFDTGAIPDRAATNDPVGPHKPRSSKS